MFLHLHQPDVAHDFLRKSQATRHDPWLTAAEIAIASYREKTPQLFKTGLSLIDSGNWRPHQTNELAAAIGTHLLNDGYHKRGKRMMLLGLADPTGNTLAQAEWVTAKFGETLLEASTLKSSTDANEARTFRFYRTGLYAKSLESATDWLDEEPFLNRAYIAATAAANMMEDYTRTLEFADAGLKFDPISPFILQNKIYALACSGSMDDAERILESVPQHDGAEYVAEANRGLIAFRRSQLDVGVRHYRAAISGFKKTQNIDQECTALAYLAREAVRAEMSTAIEVLREAEKILGSRENQQARKILKDARTMLEVRNVGLSHVLKR
jgi:tetratricopeptide (TPR) repeat protein